METLIYLIKFVICSFGVVVFLTCIYFIWKEIRKERKANELAYDMKYLHIQDAVTKWEVCESNFAYLKDQLKQLGHLKHKNREKTTVLTVSFFMKYATIARKEAIK